jgi:hypothetical protein
MMFYFLDAGDGFYALEVLPLNTPDGWTQITDDEAVAYKYVPPPPSPLEQIRALEQEQLMPRATREFMLLFMETQAPPEVLAVNLGYIAVKAFDGQIKELRDQL